MGRTESDRMTRREYMQNYRAKNRRTLLPYRAAWKRDRKSFILCAKAAGDATIRNQP